LRKIEQFWGLDKLSYYLTEPGYCTTHVGPDALVWAARLAAAMSHRPLRDMGMDAIAKNLATSCELPRFR
jgi:hypothetical protein